MAVMEMGRVGLGVVVDNNSIMKHRRRRKERLERRGLLDVGGGCGGG